LAAIVTANVGRPAAIFSHCDPAGDDSLNKTLGDRRVIAIYALLTRQPKLWEDIYAAPAVGDEWGTRAVQAMLASLKGRATDDAGDLVEDPNTNPYYAGALDGDYGPATSAAVRAFQTDSGNAADGQAGPATRKALFGAYMDWLCTPEPQEVTGSNDEDDAGTAAKPSAGGEDASTSPPPFRMQLSDFLGGLGAQPGDLPKMTLQSCGKFNPVVLLTKDRMEGADKSARNASDAPNRRVLIFFFEQGTMVAASLWPCPKVKESNDACKAAFWPDGDARRQNGAALRQYRITRDTMACRFYDRFARRSPCEGVDSNGFVGIWLHDHFGQRMGARPDSEDPVEQTLGAPYRIVFGVNQVRVGYADKDGLLTEYGIVVRKICRIQWGKQEGANVAAPPETDADADGYYTYDEELFLDTTGSGEDKAPRQLLNLGYIGSEDEAREAFADDYSGSDDDLIAEVHATGRNKPDEG
jgi:hypothetical protein